MVSVVSHIVLRRLPPVHQSLHRLKPGEIKVSVKVKKMELRVLINPLKLKIPFTAVSCPKAPTPNRSAHQHDCAEYWLRFFLLLYNALP